MSLLAPLYIAGALAIALPILFHLIRRTPQGRHEFSSLMFLSPSPPRITRRSRIQNLLLLLLRAAALAILALAFARPFMRQAADASITETRGRRVAILVDTSASMLRGDLQSQARQQVEGALSELDPADEIALFSFDRTLRPTFGFEQWNGLPPERRMPALRSILPSITATHAATQIGEALAAAADILAAGADPDAAATERRLILISDMQRGGHVETLQRYDWPAGVALEVRPVASPQATNASLQLVTGSTAEAVRAPDAANPAGAAAPHADANRLRVRISNEAGGTREQFALAWAGPAGPIAGTEIKTYVPPGRSQVVRMPLPGPAGGADRIALSGDDFDFDNTLFIVPPRTESVRIIYLGSEAADDIKGLQYYARSALGDTARRSVAFLAQPAADPIADADLLDARLVIVADTLPDERLLALRKFAEAGGDILWILRDASAAPPLAKLMRLESPEIAESTQRDFALLARLEFDHPLLQPFADPRFSDFSRVHFWKHRRLRVDEGPGLRVLARFDRGDPFLIEQLIGQGRLFVMTAGWHPADSQLALSTKFVPLMEGFLKPRNAVAARSQYAVHEPIAFPAAADSAREVLRPDGGRITMPANLAAFNDADLPGIYRLVNGDEQSAVAVNLSPDESRTAPLAADELEQFGVILGVAQARAELTQRRRQLERTELENRQKLWRWLIVGVIGLLAVETLLAGRLARRERSAIAPASQPQVTA